MLTPTREIALQVAAVLRALAAEVPALVVGTLIGGLPIEDDQKLLRRYADLDQAGAGRFQPCFWGDAMARVPAQGAVHGSRPVVWVHVKFCTPVLPHWLPWGGATGTPLMSTIPME